MSPVAAVRSALTRLFDFHGRSPRAEYWWVFAFSVLVVFVVQAAGFSFLFARYGAGVARDGVVAADNYPSVLLLMLAIFIINFFMLPTTARRFHDHGWGAGWFVFAAIVNAVLGLAVLVAIIVTLVSGPATAMRFFGGWLMLPAFIPYASVIWTFWIGFVRPEPAYNRYGPNPYEVNQ